jgi:hypothetical protein
MPRLARLDAPGVHHHELFAVLNAKRPKRGQVLSAFLSAFTYDESGNYSETAHVSATPTPDPTPPTPPTGLEIVNSP